MHQRLSEPTGTGAHNTSTTNGSVLLNTSSSLLNSSRLNASILGTRRASTGGGFSSLAARRRSVELEEKRCVLIVGG